MRVRSPEAGAIVLFAGTTRNTFQGRAVKDLDYQAYVPLALQTMMGIARGAVQRHGLQGVAIVHRLGVVPVAEKSVLIAVSSAHRKAAWVAGEDCLREVKERVEIWKLERLEDDPRGVWRANRDGDIGEMVGEGSEARRIANQIRGHGTDATRKDPAEKEESVSVAMGSVIRPRRLGESGHGAIVHGKPRAPPE